MRRSAFALLAVALWNISFWNILPLTVVSAAAPPMSFRETVIPLATSFSVPQEFAVADLDQANGPDIVVLGHHADLAVLLNQGNGTFASPQYIDSPCEGFASAHTFAVGEFSSDSNPDILVACENKNSDGFKRLLGHGDGTFAEPETMAPILTDVGGFFGDVERMQLGTYGNAAGQAGTGLQSIVFTSSFLAGTGVTFLCFVPVADLIAGFDSSTPVVPTCSTQFDPNGNALVSYTIYDTYVLAPTPFAVSEPAAFAFLPGDTPSDPQAVNLGAITYGFGGGIQNFVQGPNEEVFVPSQPLPGSSVVAAGDLDHDGVADIVALDGGHDFAVYKIAGSGDLGPGFRSIPGPLVVPTDPAHGYPSDATIADFDGDGKLDVAVLADIGDGETGTIEIYPGNGDGTFGAAQSFATDSDSGRLTVADLDGVGLPDLVNLNRGEQVVTIQLNTTPLTPPNNPPTCSNGSAAVFAGNPLNGSVTCADSDAGDSITVSAVAASSHGSLTVSPDGTFTYTPDAGFAGSDSFTFKATDSHAADSTIATESIVVNNTPLGTKVLVTPDPNVQVTFAGVSAVGLTQATSSAVGPALPSGFEAAGLYWDITTTATFTPPIEVCISAPGVASPHLFHATGGVFVDVTTRVAPPFVCGAVSSLSPFVVGNSCGQIIGTKPKPKIHFAMINSDPRMGNDSFSLTGEFVIPGTPAFSLLDPRTNGARVVVESGSGEVRIDASLPAGRFAGKHSRGWKLSKKGNIWTYVDTTGSALDGITHFVIVDKSKKAPGRVLVRVAGAKGTYGVVPDDVPLFARVVLGGPAEADLCGETAFAATDCKFNRKQNAVTCKTP